MFRPAIRRRTLLRMNNPALTHFVFVDFENVPSVDLDAIGAHPVHVTLLIGKNQKKLEVALVQQILRLTTRVDLLEVGDESFAKQARKIADAGGANIDAQLFNGEYYIQIPDAEHVLPGLRGRRAKVFHRWAGGDRKDSSGLSARAQALLAAILTVLIVPPLVSVSRTKPDGASASITGA